MKISPAAAAFGMVLLVVSVVAARAAAPQPAAPQPAAPQPAAPQPAAPAPGNGDVIASVNGLPITRAMLEKPLLEGYGLNILLNLMQLELAKQNAANAKIIVTPQDIAAEREQTIDRMFKDTNEKLQDKIQAALDKKNNAEADRLREQIRQDNEKAYELVLQNQHLSKAEFDIVIEKNTYLRKIAEPMLAHGISEANLKEAFAALYGETVKVRHIQLSNLQEVQEAKRRLDAGEPFGKVAVDMSRNMTTGPLGGAMRPFSMQMQGLPQQFKDTAFKLKKGEVSDPVQADGAYHLILLEERIPPKAVKFEDVKESLRNELQSRALEATVTQLRAQLADQAIKGLKINEPVLKRQFDDRMQKRATEVRGREESLKQVKREHERMPTSNPDLLPPDKPPAPAPAPAN